MNIRENDKILLPTINQIISSAADAKIDFATIYSSEDISFKESFRKTVLELMPLSKLTLLKGRFGDALVEIESESSKSNTKEIQQSLRYGILKQLNEINESGIIHKAFHELTNESTELKLHLQKRVKEEIPSQFHQFINICQSTIDDLMSEQELTITRARQIKKRIDQEIESLKYSCLFENISDKLLKILPEIGEGIVPIEKLKEVSDELYYLVAYEAMTKFLEVVSGGEKSLAMTTLKDYVIEDLGFVQRTPNPADLYVKIIEASTRRNALTLNKDESSASELKRIMEKNEELVQAEYRQFLKDYKNSQKASFIPAKGSYRGVKFEGIGLEMLSHEKLFENEVTVHKEQETKNGETISKYKIIDSKDRAWETNSIIVDLTRHIKEHKILGGMISAKFRVSVTVYSRCAVYKRAPIF
ncbi:hypothetical protein [Bdellovibrio sp. BCCA]|uniref:hypothetical protein n=1 Tax=Bdellovibrio sp. BCCA TaxID=3136281 RepID=UPI0030F18F37